MSTRAEQAGASCMVVLRNGQLVNEWYWGGTNASTQHEAFSVTKSVAATLIGIAQDKGLLTIDQPASDFIREWKGTPSEAVTIRQLLSNTSGRYWDFSTDYRQMAFISPDKSAFAVGLSQQSEPGTTWVYNNSAVQTLEVVLERAIEGSVVDFATDNLFEPIGSAAYLSTDIAGNAGLFAGMHTSCRDLANFAELYLESGTWNGQVVVSSAFFSRCNTAI